MCILREPPRGHAIGRTVSAECADRNRVLITVGAKAHTSGRRGSAPRTPDAWRADAVGILPGH